MTDRRRVNGPAVGTTPAVFAQAPSTKSTDTLRRLRKPNELRKIFLQTGLIPAANGSAYLELEVPSVTRLLVPPTSSIKLSCSVHGPKPLPRNAAFSPNLQLTASVKFAPFATPLRRGYIRDSTERDLGVHLENALKGVILPDRWPKSALEIAITVLEGESESASERESGQTNRTTNTGLMNILAGCFNVAAAALADARIDCLDLLAGGVAAAVMNSAGRMEVVLDPCSAEHDEIVAASVVGFLPSRDEITEIWSSGSLHPSSEGGGPTFAELVDRAVDAARGAQSVLKEVVMETAMRESPTTVLKSKGCASNDEINDIEMKT